jgi:photosystem II stability/assembly factor-like uncharacterized protein
MLKNKYYIFLMTLLFAVLFTQAYYPQQISTELYSGMQWRLVGPFRGGWGTVCDGIPDSLNTFYFGGAGGGVWRTRDAGNTWQGLMQNESSSAIGALAISPSDPNTIYVGTGQVAFRYDILEGDGVYKTIDGGETWKNIGLKETKHTGKILVDPNNSKHVLVAALGPVFGSSKDRGLYLTENGGETWKQVLFVNDSTGAVDLAYDPLHPEIIYAALWQMRMHPWLDYYMPKVGRGSGIYKSIDGGEHWTKLSIDGLENVPLGRIGLAVAQGSNGKIVYAVIDAAKNKKGLYRSNDGGQNWLLVNNDGVLTGDYFSRINLQPGNPEIIYVMGQSIRRSTDGGKTFTIFHGAPGGDDYHYMWINPEHPNNMITASDQGTIVSVNGAETWSSWYNQPTGQLYHLAADDRFPYRIYAGQQDNGTVSILSRGPYGVIEDRDWHPVGANERDYDIPNPDDPDMVIGSGLGGDLARFDEITRQSAEISPYPHSSYAQKQNTVKLRYSWITPIAFSPTGKHALYFGAQFLFRSTNNGSNWEVVSPDLSRKTDDTTNYTDPDLTQAADCGYGVIWSIAPSPLDEKIIWVGTDDGLIHLTTDEGKNWSNVSPPDVPLWGRIDAVDPSPFSVHSAYVAVNLHRLNNFTPLILKTTDDGKTWKKIINGLPVDEYVNVVRTDRDKEGLLFAGTNRSVYVSFDDGENWHPLKLNFPTTSVRDLLVHKNDLIAATQGRAIWILDDLQPLREIDETMVSNSVHLFKPSDAWRIRGNENRDTPWPPSTALGKNPPDGAIIYYRLKNDAQKITLRISDAEGNTIREYSNMDKPEKLNAYRYFDERWLGTPEQLSGNAGMHRFVWDLRYTRPKALRYNYSIAATWKEGTPVNPRGPLVLPGTYNVSLNVDGKEFTQQLTVKLDPRVSVNPEDLKQQLAVAITVITALEQTVDVHNRIDAKLKDSVNILSKEISDSLKSLLSEVDKISNVFAGLVTSVQSADTNPSQGQIDLFDEYRKKFKEVLQRWKSLRSKFEMNY